MQQYLKISIGIFLALAASRFIPHPPNFTNLIALSFYIPALLGVRYLPIVLFSFAITDIFFSFHLTILFTWGSILIIGWFAKFFSLSVFSRFQGILLGVFSFFLITNFGVWATGYYGYTINGLVNSYFMALPFLLNNLTSSIAYAMIFELAFKIFIIRSKSRGNFIF